MNVGLSIEVVLGDRPDLDLSEISAALARDETAMAPADRPATFSALIDEADGVPDANRRKPKIPDGAVERGF